VKKKFISEFKEAIDQFKRDSKIQFDFMNTFVKTLANLESKTNRVKVERAEKGPRKFQETRKGKDVHRDQGKKTEEPPKTPEPVAKPKPVDNGNNNNGENGTEVDMEAKIQENIEKLRRSSGKRPAKITKKPSAPTKTTS